MRIVFDKNLETEHEVAVNFFGENISRNTLNASMNKVLTVNDVNVPDLSSIKVDFTTVDIFDGDIPVPVQGDYNTVLDASAAYNSRTKEYSVTVILGRKQVA